MATENNVITIDQRSFVGKYPVKPRYRKYRSNSQNPLNNHQVGRLVKAAKYHGRHGLRDATMIMLAYQHGLRVSELINLKWNHIDLKEGTLLVSRLKNGQKTIHPLTEAELNNLRLLEEKYTDLEFVFVSERKTPLTKSHVVKMLKRAGEEAGLATRVQPDMLNGIHGFNLMTVRAAAQVTQH